MIQLWQDCGLVAPQNNPVRDIKRKMDTSPESFFVGEEDAKIIASCMVDYGGHRGWIYYLAVAPSEQRQGFAREIMNHAERFLCAAGCPKINLQVRSSNTAVLEFYKSLDFAVEDVVSMGKRLEVDEPHGFNSNL